MNRLLSLMLLPTLIGCASQPAPAPGSAGAPSPDGSLRMLLDGNTRYVADHPEHGAAHGTRRAEIAKAQHPVAVVVCCSDSRVGPEIVFDQDLGDIFVIRTAGNVVDDVELGSIEYAVEHLKTPLVLVVGHERCGAVTAAVEGGEAPGHLPAFIRAIAPAVEQSKGQPGDAVDNAVRQNVRVVVKQLRTAGPILAESVHSGTLKVVGARYDLDTGRVEIIE